MKMKYFVILICLLSSIQGISYAQEFSHTKNKNTHFNDREMMELFHYDNRKAEAKSLLEKKQVHFDWISNYFEKDGNIKSIYITSPGEIIIYTDQINENDYEQLRNNLDYIMTGSDFFEWGIKADYWRDIVSNNIHVTIYDNTLFKESGGYWCSEYFIYDKDDFMEKNLDSFNASKWAKKEMIDPDWYFKQDIDKVSIGNNSLGRWMNQKKEIKANEWAKESELLSFERVKIFIDKHQSELNEFKNFLNEKDLHFHYSRFLNHKYDLDGRQYNNLNEFRLQKKLSANNIMYENFDDKIYILFCKKVENFIRLLEENNLVLPAGVSVNYKKLIGGKPILEIYTRSKSKDSQCLNITITYDGTGEHRGKDKSMKMLMPDWYYKSEIGEIQAMKGAE